MLSIVIPTLNEQDYLPRLLKSIKIQTFKDYEIIVADAGSKDRTKKIAKDFGCKVIKGGLPAKGRNEGAKVAQGDLILFLDADVKLPTKDFLKKTLREFKKRKLDIASCLLQPLEKSRYLNKKILNFCFDLVNYLMIFSEKLTPFGVGSMILVKKDLHQKIKGFNEKLRFGEDNYYIRQAAKCGKFGILRQVSILWSIRRFEKEKWLKPLFLYFLGWFWRGNEKRLKIFEKGFLKYQFNHYKIKQLPKKNYLDLKKIKKILEKEIFKI